MKNIFSALCLILLSGNGALYISKLGEADGNCDKVCFVPTVAKGEVPGIAEYDWAKKFQLEDE